ncbi:MAG: hypothetical protein IIX04_03400 [Alistipes sp.]|nr:hypothetical protein [Alistipes sp.]
MKHLFFGGIHPKYNKEMSKTIPTVKTIEPKSVVIPMLQHIGAPCTPRVAVGDRVLKGQKIGDGEGLCVPVHASVSGVVKAIEPRPHVRGTLLRATYPHQVTYTLPQSGRTIPKSLNFRHSSRWVLRG